MVPPQPLPRLRRPAAQSPPRPGADQVLGGDAERLLRALHHVPDADPVDPPGQGRHQPGGGAHNERHRPHHGRGGSSQRQEQDHLGQERHRPAAVAAEDIVLRVHNNSVVHE